MYCGVAVKPSVLPNLFEFVKIVRKYFNYCVIDAEYRPFDEAILESLAMFSNIVVTIQSKRENVFQILDKYSSYDFEFCIVLGNSAYLNNKEKKFSNKRILDVISYALNFRDNIWVGTEGVESLVRKTIEEHDLIAYYLYGQEINISSRKAIYVPYSTKIDNKKLKLMEGYLNRRKCYDGEWEKFLLSLNNYKTLKKIATRNDVIIGHPIIPNKIEVINFYKTLEDLKKSITNK